MALVCLLWCCFWIYGKLCAQFEWQQLVLSITVCTRLLLFTLFRVTRCHFSTTKIRKKKQKLYSLRYTIIPTQKILDWSTEKKKILIAHFNNCYIIMSSIIIHEFDAQHLRSCIPFHVIVRWCVFFLFSRILLIKLCLFTFINK